VTPLKRVYLDQDVYSASVDRMVRLYAGGHRVVVSASGGKDSTVCVEICRIAARMTDRLPVEVHHRDDEVMLPGTFEYLERLAQDPEIDMHHWYSGEPVGYWFCRSIPFYWPFDPEVPPEQWVRRPPAHAERVVEHLPWYVNATRFPPPPGKQLISVLGLRAQESPWRRLGIHSSGGYLTRQNRVGAVVARPIYDWTDRDVWRFIAQTGSDYNRAYDVMVAAGIPGQRLRISSIGIVVSSLYDHPKLANAFPGWARKLEKRLGRDVGRIAELGAGALRPDRQLGESWTETVRRECIDHAPAWIAARTAEVVSRAVEEHGAHAGGAGLPDETPCQECGAYGSYRVIARRLYWGDPWPGGWPGNVRPEQFRPDKLGRLA
jgi:3'-phosphoadenosine 5'-phosphosulfate sulfotransferase (PAPS reductase)/FAD synthetase